MKSDLINNRGHALVGGDPKILELAWEWVRAKEQAPLPAKRDMDLIRELLLEIEAGAKQFQTVPLDPMERIRVVTPELTAKRSEHLHLLKTADLIEVTAENMAAGRMIVRGLTWKAMS